MRNHDAGWNVCLLLVDGGEGLLVVGAALESTIVVHGLVWHTLAHHWVATGHLALLAGFHLSAALGIPPAAVLTTIPPVLDGVVAAAMEAAGNLSPSLAHLGDHLLDHGALLGSDGVVVEVRLEVLVIPFPALLGGSGLDHRRDADPVVSTLSVDEAKQELVLSLGPGTSLVSRHSDVRLLL